MVLDELGDLPFVRSGALLLIHLISKSMTHLRRHHDLPPFGEWPAVFGELKPVLSEVERMTMALLDRATHHIVEKATMTGTDHQ